MGDTNEMIIKLFNSLTDLGEKHNELAKRTAGAFMFQEKQTKRLGACCLLSAVGFFIVGKRLKKQEEQINALNARIEKHKA